MTPSQSKLLIPSALLLLGLPACSSGGGSSDPHNNVTVGFDLPSSSAGENAGPLVVTLSLSAAVGADVSVPFALAGTAIENVDYTTTAVSPLVIVAGDLVAQITFVLIDDGACEGDESIEVTLGVPINADLGAQAVHMATVEDGVFIEIEPNNSAADSNDNGTISVLSPGVSCELLGTIDFTPGEFDVYRYEVSETTLLTIDVVPSSGIADLAFFIASEFGPPLTGIFNSGIAGETESGTVTLDPNDPGVPAQSPFHLVVWSLSNSTNYSISISGAVPVVVQDPDASAPSIESTQLSVTFEGGAPRVAISHELK